MGAPRGAWSGGGYLLGLTIVIPSGADDSMIQAGMVGGPFVEGRLVNSWNSSSPCSIGGGTILVGCRTAALQTSLSRPDAYLCSRLEISVWYGSPSASARF